jgi:PilZ domain
MIPQPLLPAATLIRILFKQVQFGCGCVMDISKRAEDRTPMKVTVDLSSLDIRTPAQEGVTENVSPRGARVLTNKPWKPNDRLNVRSLLGNFRSRARVVYCIPVDGEQFAIGLQLFAAAGNWRSPQ